MLHLGWSHVPVSAWRSRSSWRRALKWARARCWKRLYDLLIYAANQDGQPNEKYKHVHAIPVLGLHWIEFGGKKVWLQNVSVESDKQKIQNDSALDWQQDCSCRSHKGVDRAYWLQTELGTWNSHSENSTTVGGPWFFQSGRNKRMDKTAALRWFCELGHAASTFASWNDVTVPSTLIYIIYIIVTP